MVPDPYKALGLSHDASPTEIKHAYRKMALQYHPDRLTRQRASPEECQVASEKFAQISSAYALLTDEKRKRQYDHIFKYGGYDDDSTNKAVASDSRSNGNYSSSTQRATTSGRSGEDPFTPYSNGVGGKRTLQKGIGYSISDPFAFLFSQGKRQATTVAGIQIPSRIHLANPQSGMYAGGANGGGGGLRFAFSSAQLSTGPNGSRQYVSKTTQFVQGKKFTRVETTTIHPDGRKEVVIEGNDYVERHSTPPKKKKKKEQKEDVASKENQPWYMDAWNGIRDKLTMCYNPCGAIQVQ